ncbi:MAG TPA: NACHT domain-containing protein [Ktedonobacteraceae bacterium]
MQQATGFNVFCGCAPEDEAGAERLHVWLKLLEEQGHIHFYSHRSIRPGSERKTQLEHFLDIAQIILLLISIDFIRSKEGNALCTRAIERHRREGVCVIPVLYQPTSWQEETPLGELQAVPKGGKPIVLWDNQDLAFTEVFENFKEVLGYLQQRLARPPADRQALAGSPSAQAGDPAGAQGGPCLLEDAEQRQRYLRRFVRRLDADLTSLYIGHNLRSAQSSVSYLNFLAEVYQSRKKCWLITGDPGLGKTTLLHMLGIEHARRVDGARQTRLPVFIELSGYAQYMRPEHRQADLLCTFAAYLATRSLTDFEGITVDEVERQLKNQGYVLLLDALDEIGEPGLRHKVIENLKVIMDKSECLLLITSRISATTSYDAISKAAVVKELSPFTPGQIEAYLRQYQAHSVVALPADWCEKLLADLPHNRHLQDLLATPLLLNMMADILSQSSLERRVPDQYVELCERYITHVIEVRPGQRPGDIGAHRPIIHDHHRQRDYFASIAYHLHLNHLPDGTSFKLVDYIRPLAGQQSDDEIKKDLDQLVTEVGILQRRPPGTYAFRHATFQEFFVADYLFRKPGNLSEYNVRELLRQHLSDPGWRQIIIFYYARSSRDRALSSEWLLAALIEQQDDLFASRTFVAADCLQAAGAQKHPQYGPISRSIKQKYHDTPYYALQDELFRAIRQLSERAFLPFLQDELNYADRARRLRAIEALGSVEKEAEQATAVSLLRVAYEKDPGLRAYILDASLALGPALTLGVLLDWLEDDPLLSVPLLAKITTADERDWLAHLVGALEPARLRPWMYEAVEHLGSHPTSPVVQERFEQWLANACDQDDRAQLLLLLHALRFPIRASLQERLYRRRSGLDPEQDPELFIALVCFAGHQQDERASEPLFDLLLDQRIAHLPLADRREPLQLALLKAWLAIDSKDSCEYISAYLRETTSALLWKEVVPWLVERGNAVYFALLCEQLLVSAECWPGTFEIPLMLIWALARMSKDRTPSAVVRDDVRAYLLALFAREPMAMAEAVEASAFLLGRADRFEQESQGSVPGGSLQRLLETFTALNLGALNDALVRAVLDQSCPPEVQEPVLASSFCTCYLQHPQATPALALQLRAKILGSGTYEQKQLLLTALERGTGEVQKKAVELACRLLDSTDTEVQARILRWLQKADGGRDAQTIQLVLLYLGESGSLATLTALPRFLYGETLQLQQTAFKTIRDIVRRHEADISECMTLLAMGGQTPW